MNLMSPPFVVVNAGHQVEDGGLSRAVGLMIPAELPLPDDEAHVADSWTAEELVDALQQHHAPMSGSSAAPSLSGPATGDFLSTRTSRPRRGQLVEVP